ncbi:MAG: hypothetical protein LBQ78_08350 [Tannerellaceae bacterium]|jgi:hypothetical protein|nr:hypothetical protein [Tannerellaceae bacterium]
MQQMSFKKVLSYLPEVSLMLMAGWWFLDNLLGASTVNYIMIAIIGLLLTLIVWRNKILAVALSILLGAGSLFMILAVLSEYGEFPTGDPEGRKLLLIGVLIFVTLTVMALVLPRKYLYRQ